jgi:epoxyqueuosine reductase
MDSARKLIEAEARREHLKFFGIVPLDFGLDFDRYVEWLKNKGHAGMSYLEKNLEYRKNPEGLLPGARVAIVFGLPYSQNDRWPKHGEVFQGPPRIAQYARFADYHKILRTKLDRIAAGLHRELGETTDVYRVLVDSAPVLERAMAAQSSRGFIGKNSCFIHPEAGSFFLLSEILTSLDLAPDERTTVDATTRSAQGGCGICNRCQVKCPTGALDEAFRINANECISYWTIEHRGPIPEKYWPWLKYYFFGCDICQLVCPYNGPSEGMLPPTIAVRTFPSLFEIAVMDQQRYELFFGGTALTRAKRNGLRRNALIAMTVISDSQLQTAVEIARQDDDYPIADTLIQIENYLMRKSV